MSRGQGRVFRPKDTANWWLDYSVRGKRHRESTGTSRRAEAVRILRERIAGREVGTLVGRPDRVLLAEYRKDEDGKEELVGGLRALAERQYQIDGRRSLDRLRDALNKLEAFFGRDARALELTRTQIDLYAAHRLAHGAARATVNYELAALRRAFRLAIETNLLAVMPHIKLPKVHNERQGFFEEGDFAALVLELPGYLRPIVKFARLTGWRVHKDVLPLMWEAVDWEGQVIRLAQADTKGGEARLFPFSQAPALQELLKAQWAARDGLFVFHRHGRRIHGFRTAWANACRRAGLAGRIPHDLRRSAARDLRRAGVSEGEIMKLCGWRTRAMFDRYNIIDEADLAAAVAKRFANGAVASQAPSSEPVAGKLG
jgi:integrase